MDMNKLAPLVKGLEAYINYSGKRLHLKKPSPPIARAKFDYIKDAASDCFTVGFGKMEILPSDILKHKYYVAGYGGNNPATGVLDAPAAHAVWIDDNSGRGGVIFVSLDIVGILNDDVNELRKYISGFTEAFGCRSVNILATHNHAGIDTMGIWGPLPISGRDSKYMKLIFDRVREAVQIAYADRRNGSLYYGTCTVPDMQEDIRLPIVYSRTLTRLRFVPQDGGKEIYMLNFASHSESLQGCNSRVSADFPCYLRREILEKTGAETIYFVGAIGGMISMDIPNENEIRNNSCDFADNTEKIGKKLAGYAISIKKEKKLSPRINLLRQEFYCGIDNLILTVAAKLKIIRATQHSVSWASRYVALKTEMTYFEIGDLKLLLLPGELFPELVFGGYLDADESGTGWSSDINPTPLTEIAGEKELLVFGLANDELGYILPPNDFLLDPVLPYLNEIRDSHGRKHYEETNSLGPDTAAKIAEVFSSVMETVRETKENA